MPRMPVHLVILIALFAGLTAQANEKAPVTITKTLRHWLDLEGRHTTSPSLLDRDAYQAHLRDHPEEVSTLRFDLQLRFRTRDRSGYRIQVEIRHGSGSLIEIFSTETALKPRGKRRSFWNQIPISKKDYQALGDIIAWRVTVWEGPTPVARDESFLW